MYAIIIPEIVNPKTVSNAFFINAILELIKPLFVPSLSAENTFVINNIDQIRQIINNNGKIMIEVVVFLKKVSGYFVMTTDIITKNKINPIPPYLEKNDNFSNPFGL